MPSAVKRKAFGTNWNLTCQFIINDYQELSLNGRPLYKDKLSAFPYGKTLYKDKSSAFPYGKPNVKKSMATQ